MLKLLRNTFTVKKEILKEDKMLVSKKVVRATTNLICGLYERMIK